MTTSRVYRTDISVLRPVERRADGTILVDAFLSKCGVFQYYQPDGTIRRELRLPEDVHDGESLKSFEGRPVTNNHPPGMIDSKNARQYSVGAVIGTPVPDSDHIRGRLSIFDASAVGDMEGGKVQVSNGYSCDCIESPGVHPVYGAYDAIQKNIRGNHVAIVDRARAGVTASARMDADIANGMMVLDAGEETVLQPGMQVAVDTAPAACKSRAMAAAPVRIEVVVKNDANEPSATAKVDPEDLASRNARGETAAKKTAKEQPGESYEDAGNDKAKPRKGKPFPPDDDDGDDDDDDEDDDERGDRSGDVVRGAVPRGDKKKDRADGAEDTTMTMDMKALQEKADKRKAKLVAAKARIDSLETEMAQKDAQIQNLTKDLETAKAAHTDAAAPTATEAQITERVELLEQARSTGAKVDAKMSPRAIKVATIKHVDGDDVPDAKADAYVDGVYEGALKRSKKDAADTAKGNDALVAARLQVETNRTNTHLDANNDEEDAKARLRAANREMINQPGKHRIAVR